MEEDQQFVEYVLKSVVDHPDEVHVDRTIDEMGVLISVNVNPEDMGKVIGKSGQTAKAIRTLLKVVGAKNDARVNMKIIEPEGGTGGLAPSDAAPSDATATDSDDQDAGATATGGRDAFGSTDDIPQPPTDTHQADAYEPQPSTGTDTETSASEPPAGTTAAADDVPVQEESVAEAVAEQTQSDAAVPQPSENDEIVDEATGDRLPDEPLTAGDASTEADSPDDADAAGSRTNDDLARQRERSPLDDL